MTSIKQNLTEPIFDDPRWYGDHSGEAHAQRLRFIWLLRRYGADSPDALALADRLESCAPGERCRSGGCPECGGAFRNWFVDAGLEVQRDVGGGTSVLSIVPPNEQVPIGELDGAAIHAAGATIAKTLKSLSLTTALVTIDASANESREGEFDPHWQLQGWVSVPKVQVDRIRRDDIREAFPASKTVPRPVKVQVWDGDPAALAYGMKTDFVRRVSYLKPADPVRGRGECRNTRDRDLRVHQLVELLLALDSAGFRARLHLLGARLTKTADGPRIRLITPGGR
jgi:hypothetical protein